MITIKTMKKDETLFLSDDNEERILQLCRELEALQSFRDNEVDY